MPRLSNAEPFVVRIFFPGLIGERDCASALVRSHRWYMNVVLMMAKSSQTQPGTYAVRVYLHPRIFLQLLHLGDAFRPICGPRGGHSLLLPVAPSLHLWFRFGL